MRSNHTSCNVRPDTRLRKQTMMDFITEYVNQHIFEPITLKSIAAHCGVSVSTITQTFQQQADQTFHQYLTCRRMAVAKEKILEGIPLEEVGRQVGYVDHSTFYRAFRQYFGVSPREFRKQQIS